MHRNDLNYNITKLHLINELFDDKEIKNRIFRIKTRAYISLIESKSDIEKFIMQYKSICKNKNDIEYIENLKTALINLKPGNQLPNFEVIDIENNEHKFADVLKKPTLIYFWSLNHKKHFIKSHFKVKELKKEIPELEFISVNINDKNTDKWKKTTSKYHFNLDREFKLKHPHKTLKDLAISYLNKVFIVDSNQNIITSNINIYDQNINESVKKLLNIGVVTQ